MVAELTQLAMDLGAEISDKQLVIHDLLGAGGYSTVYRGTWQVGCVWGGGGW